MNLLTFIIGWFCGDKEKNTTTIHFVRVYVLKLFVCNRKEGGITGDI